MVVFFLVPTLQRGNAYRTEIMGRSRYKFTNADLPHFMTCTVLHWIPVFTQPETVAILLESLRFLTHDGMKLYAYVILENHMHLIAQSDRIDHDMARFKSFTAKRLIRYLRSHAGAWERGKTKGTTGHFINTDMHSHAGAWERDNAAATSICNRVRRVGDIKGALDFGLHIDGVRGVLVIMGDKLGILGDIELA